MNGGERVRELTRGEQDAFRLARLNAAEAMPYFMHALFATAPVAAPGLGTFAVDARWRVYLDPAQLVGPQAWSPRVAGAVLLHEVGHLIRDHAGRATALPQPHRHLEWNLAGDAEINDDLLGAGVALPAGVITPAALGCADNDLAEHYYTHLTENSNAGGGAGDDGGPGCGGGAGSGSVPAEADTAVAQVATGISDAEGDFVRRTVAQDVAAHAHAKGRGSVPAGLARWANRVLRPPTVAWERLLRAAVRRAVATQAGRTDYTYSRPSRRQVPGIITPAMRGPAVVVSLVIDTSGSMSPTDLDAAMSEVHGVLASGGIARHQVRLVSCDAAATKAQRVHTAGAVELSGGGGTDMRVGIAAAEASKPAPHVVIVLTDGDTPWPQHPTRARLVCGVISPHPPHDTPPWATTVHIPPATT